MALESCEILVFSCLFNKYHFAIKRGDRKTNGFEEWNQAFPRIFSESFTMPVRPDRITNLMPINLVKFNNETETEE